MSILPRIGICVGILLFAVLIGSVLVAGDIIPALGGAAVWLVGALVAVVFFMATAPRKPRDPEDK